MKIEAGKLNLLRILDIKGKILSCKICESYLDFVV